MQQADASDGQTSTVNYGSPFERSETNPLNLYKDYISKKVSIEKYKHSEKNCKIFEQNSLPFL